MTDSDIIDRVLLDMDGIDPADSDNAARRLRMLHFLQQVYDYVWNFREWQWTYDEGTVTLTANHNYAPLPTDFGAFGKQGGLWNADHVRMSELSRRKLERFRNETSGSTNTRVFAISGGQILLGYTPSSNSTLSIYYRIVSDSAGFTDAGADLLIPAQYHATVLVPGLVYKAQVTKQDSRPTWSAEFRDGLAQMCMMEQPIMTSTNRLPLSVRGAF